jgi:photosystem II stability/assembly factor-like uncharacterized protein
MKKFILLCILFIVVKSNAQNSLHFQYHGGNPLGGYKYNNDTLIAPLGMGNGSTLNAIGIVNINSQQWSITSYSTAFSFSATSNASFVMKNLNEGIFTTTGNQLAYSTSNFWQTTTPLTGTVNALGATKFGYYGYQSFAGCGTCTYTYVFSSNGTTWNNTLIEANAFIPPVFYKSKTKIYTLHNNLLKSSSNGGASYLPVNNTYTFNASFPVKPSILTLNDDTILVQANQLHRSFNGGATWSTIAMPTTSNAIGQIAAKNAREIMITDKFPPFNIYYSNNSGSSWVTYTNLPFSNSGTPLFANEQSFFMDPNYKSSNGSSWQDVLVSNLPRRPFDITHTGNVVVTADQGGYFAYSLNKGHSFSFVPNKVSNDGDLMAAKAIDANTFLAADRKGQIFVSTNQGQTWTQKVTSTFNNIPRKFSVSDDKSVIVMSAIGSAYVSGDGGNTFSFLNTTIGNGHYQTMRPVSNKVVDVAPLFLAPTFTLSGYEFYEITGGNVRTLTSTLTTTGNFDIVDVQMANDNVGYLMLRNTTTNATDVYKTSNAWVSTSLLSSIPSPSPSIRSYDGKYGNIQTFGTNTVIISGSGNPVNNQTNFYHISTDGGSTWTIIYPQFNVPTSILGNRIYKMSFYSANEYMALISDFLSGGPQASKGVYINTTGSGGSSGNIGINELSFKNNTSFIKVYPNPATEVLNFEMENLDKKATLKIIDVMGKTVLEESIFESEKSISIEGLAKGLYFIRVEKDGSIATSKFIKE